MVVKNKTMELRKQQASTKATDSIMEGVERRFALSDFEIRSDGEKPKLRGYALRFGSIYDMGWFTEEVDRRALDNANIKDVRVLLNHDANLILGRTTAGTANVGVDDIGLWYEVELPDSPNGVNARVAIERGDITQSSWGFRLRIDDTGRNIGNKWEMRNGKEHRILTDVAEIFDASPVVFPANPDTTVAKRSRDMVELLQSDETAADVLNIVDGTTTTVALGASISRADSTALAETKEEQREDDPTAWDIAWMMDMVAWATSRGNEMVMSITNNLQNYEYNAAGDTQEAQTFKALVEKCAAAKLALVDMINGHIDALKELNNSENRSKTQEIEQLKSFNPELREREIQLIEAEIRAKQLNYEICN